MCLCEREERELAVCKRVCISSEREERENGLCVCVCEGESWLWVREGIYRGERALCVYEEGSSVCACMGGRE